MVVEGRVVDPQMTVKVLLAPDFGPGRINAESQKAQQQIGDPDPEIDSAAANETQGVGAFAPVGRCQFRCRDLGAPFAVVALPLCRVGEQTEGRSRGVQPFGYSLLTDRRAEAGDRFGIGSFDLLVIGFVRQFQLHVRTRRTHLLSGISA